MIHDPTPTDDDGEGSMIARYQRDDDVGRLQDARCFQELMQSDVQLDTRDKK